MRIRELGEPLDRTGVKPRVGVQQQDVAARGPRDAGVPAVREASVLLLYDRHLGEPLPHERDGAVTRAVIDQDRLMSAHALERLLEPGQSVVGDDDHRDVAHLRRTPSRRMIATPGTASAIVTTKKRKPVEKA